MSVTDPSADPVQPEGQGEQGTGGAAPYADYLNRIPEDQRAAVEPVFKDWDANVTRRFQDASEFRQRFEPLQDTGIDQLTPDEVRWLTQFRGALDTPQAIQEWYQQYAEQHGLTQQQQQEQQLPDDQYGFQDPSAQQLETLLKSQLGPIQQRLEAFAQWQEAQEHQARFAEAQQMVQSQIAELKQKHPDEFNEQAVERLVAQYVETDPQHAVQRAFADWQAIRSDIERQTLQSKVNQPPPAESGGSADGAPEQIKTLKAADAIALEQLKQARLASQ